MLHEVGITIFPSEDEAVRALGRNKMKVLNEKEMLCPCCMEKHKVKEVLVVENNVFQGVPVTYDARYFYCDHADETYADEEQLLLNDTAMKNAYRKKTNQ